ncbi:hypothetical protein D3C80_451980 [compost metagenome]
MYDRRPAARDRQRIAGDLLLKTGPFGNQRIDAIAPLRADDAAIADHPHAVRHGIRRLRACIDDRRDIDTGRHQIGCRPIARPAIGEDSHLAARRHAISVGVGTHCACRHHARLVVAAENQRSLFRAGSQNGALGDDAPEPFHRQVRRRCGDMFLHPLDGTENHIVIPAEHGRARHQRDIWKCRQFLDHRLGEIGSRNTAHRGAFGQKRSAKPKTFVRKDHARTGASCSKCRHQAGRTGADDQQIAMRPGFLVAIRIGLHRQLAEAGCATDDRLVELFPKRCRPHEGFVVEARTQHRRKQAVYRADIE